MVIAEAPTYPGAVPVFSSYQADVVQIDMDADGMRIDLLEETLDRLEREGRRPKFIYTVPTFQNPAGVTMSLPRRRRLVEIARERELLVLEDNPYGLLRYEGEPLPTLLLARRRRLRDVPRHVLEDPLARASGSAGWSAPPPVLEKINLGKQAADLCTSTLSQLMVQAYFEQGALARLRRRRSPSSTARRRDTMLDALAEHFPPQASGPAPRAACSSGRRCPTSSTPPTCWRARCARTWRSCRARRPILDGRGRSSMRLNFSGSATRTTIREGIRRIGEVVTEQVDALRDAHRASAGESRARGSPPSAAATGARVLPLPAPRASASAGARGR